MEECCCKEGCRIIYTAWSKYQKTYQINSWRRYIKVWLPVDNEWYFVFLNFSLFSFSAMGWIEQRWENDSYTVYLSSRVGGAQEFWPPAHRSPREEMWSAWWLQDKLPLFSLHLPLHLFIELFFKTDFKLSCRQSTFTYTALHLTSS